MRHLLTLADYTTAEIERIFSISEELKQQCQQGQRESLLANRVMAMLFEKPSLRTRVSFEAGMAHLGGTAIFLGDAGLGKRETIADFARNLDKFADVIVFRGFLHQTVEELAKHAACPVINGLTDFTHPCQALADLYTIARGVRQVGRAYPGLDRRREQRRPKSRPHLRQAGRADDDGHTRRLPLRRAGVGLDFGSRCPSWT